MIRKSRKTGRYITKPVDGTKVTRAIVMFGIAALMAFQIGDYISGAYFDMTQPPAIKSPIPEGYEFSKPVMVKKVVEAPRIEEKRHFTAVTWGDFQSIAKSIAEEEEYPYQVLIGQAAVETGRGRSRFAMERFNYFGLCAYDSNPNAAHSYESVEDGIRAYIKLIKTAPRYQKAWAHKNNPVAMVREIKAAGYASDPLYVEKVTGVPEFTQ